jgi:hypothetical protein
MRPSDEAIRAVLTDLAHERGRGASFCPSEAARRLGVDWRPLMDDIRRVAATMQAEGALRATQSGAPVDPGSVRGPMRLTLP